MEWQEGKLVARTGLAEDWKPAPGGWTIHLRSGIRWSDGIPLESQHLLDGWEVVLSQCKHNPESQGLFFLQNARAFCEGKVPFSQVGAKRIDASTLQIQTNLSAVSLPFRLAQPAVFPLRKRFEKDYPPTLGPFLVEKAAPLSLRLIRNPFYRPESVAFSGVDVQIVPSATTRIQMFLEGETDIVDEIPTDLFSQLTLSSHLQAVPTARSVVLGFLPPYRSAPLRTWRFILSRAFDKEELQSLAKAPISFATAFPFEIKGPEPVTYNPTSAKKIVTDALKAEVLRMNVASGLEKEGIEVFENLRAQWFKNLGIHLESSSSSHAAVELRELTWDIYDPSAWTDPELKAQVSDLGIVPLYRRARYVLKSSKVEALTPLPDGSWDFR